MEKWLDMAWDCDLPVPNWKFVLLAIASYADKDCIFHGGIEELVELTGLHDAVVTNALISLGARGLVVPGIGHLALCLGEYSPDAFKAHQIRP